MKIGKIVREIMNARELTQENFATAINESLVDTTVGRVSVSNWLNGKYEPDTDFLEAMLVAYKPGDWRFSFALTCLGIKNPLVWGKQGVVWQLQTTIKQAAG